MPIVTVSMYNGRTQREKDRLSEAIIEDKDIKGKERRGNYSISRSNPWKLVLFRYSTIII